MVQQGGGEGKFILRLMSKTAVPSRNTWGEAHDQGNTLKRGREPNC